MRGSVKAVALAMLVLGIMLGMNYRIQAGQESSLAYQRYAAAQRLLHTQDVQRAALEAQVARLRRRLAAMPQPGASTAGLRKALSAAELAAGMTTVSGAGVVVTLDDSKARVAPGANPEDYLLHDQDLLRTVNELNLAGAEAVSINGQRLTASSQIRCAGPTISVNEVRIAPPVHIVAIGDPARLAAAIEAPGAIQDTLRFWGIQVRVHQKRRVVVPGYAGPLILRYARPGR